MSKKLTRAAAVLGVSAAMMTGSAFAQGRGHSKSSAPVWNAERDHARDWRGDRDRWTFGDDQRPRGWDKGRKTGWGDCDVPPGQAKKMGCNSTSRIFQHRRRDDRRDRNHRYENYRRDRQ